MDSGLDGPASWPGERRFCHVLTQRVAGPEHELPVSLLGRFGGIPEHVLRCYPACLACAWRQPGGVMASSPCTLLFGAQGWTAERGQKQGARICHRQDGVFLFSWGVRTSGCKDCYAQACNRGGGQAAHVHSPLPDHLIEGFPANMGIHINDMRSLPTTKET